MRKDIIPNFKEYNKTHKVNINTMELDNNSIDLSDINLGDLTFNNTACSPGSITSTGHGAYSYTTIKGISPSEPSENDFVINRPGKPPLRVGETLESIMDRLSILQPDFDKMDRYPALREAYLNYKTIEALLTSEDNEQQ